MNKAGDIASNRTGHGDFTWTWCQPSGRLSGKLVETHTLVPGGGHLSDDSAWFLTGRAADWLQMTRNQVNGLIAQQQPDGSFRYRGQYQKGHYEDTASGYCARPAAVLLEYAKLTGDKLALSAGLKTLDYMKRFRVPRGAQTWELSLHTPIFWPRLIWFLPMFGDMN
jgi:hypothetical protein